MECGRCGSSCREGARFCDACGERVAAPPGGLRSGIQAGDQRHVTVVFVDLVDATALSRKLDLETWRDFIREFQGACFQEISRAGGWVAQFLGDGVLAYFGFPVAREHDAEAAVRAALGVLKALERHDRPAGHADRIAARIGIHSGVVLASEMGFGASRQPLVVGEVPNVAARIQAEAQPNTVVISESTHRLIRDAFVWRPLGSRQLRGLGGKLMLYVVSRPRSSPGERSRSGKELPLVGRARELELLRATWAAARGGHGRILVLTGEAGVGKSRLVRELRADLPRGTFARVDLFGAPHSESSALFPVLEFARRAWRLERDESPEQSIAKVRRGLGRHGDRRESLELMLSLLEIRGADLPPVSANTPRRQKELSLSLLADLLFESAGERPTLLVVEDIQWVDPTTQELLQIVAPRIEGAAILMILLSRSPQMPEWVTHLPAATHLEISRLDADDTAALIRHMSMGTSLSAELVGDLVDRCDGIPLYVEEVTRMVLGSGGPGEEPARPAQARSLADLGIPPTLHESLIARLDELGAARDLAQLGAAVGRSFEAELVGEVAGVDGTTLRAMLTTLEEAQVVRRVGSGTADTYVFRHALIQDAAYASLVPSRRRQHHLKIAEVLEARAASGQTVRSELLAHHFAAANRIELAISHLVAAGKHAFERSAYVEAGRHLEQGLALVAGVSDPRTREVLELTLCLALGPVLVATRGYSNPEVERVYARARALCPARDGDRLLYAVLSGLHLFHQSRAELGICGELADHRLTLARQLEDPMLEMHVMETVGTIAFWRGEHAAAVTALAEALARYDPARGRTIRLMYGTDSRVVSEAYLALALWYSGYPDQARGPALSAVGHARAIDDIHSLALALVFAAIVLLNRGELAPAEALAEEAVARSTEQRLEQWQGAALFVSGVVKARNGQASDGLAFMWKGAEIYQAVGAKVGGRFFAASLGEVFQLAGRAQDGLDALSALDSGMVLGEDRCHDAELARIQGELALAAGGERAAAAAAFQRGIGLARSQGALSLELRCSIALARLRRDEGRFAEARAVLAPIRASIREGSETTDARSADALLASLPA